MTKTYGDVKRAASYVSADVNSTAHRLVDIMASMACPHSGCEYCHLKPQCKQIGQALKAMQLACDILGEI